MAHDPEIPVGKKPVPCKNTMWGSFNASGTFKPYTTVPETEPVDHVAEAELAACLQGGGR